MPTVAQFDTTLGQMLVQLHEEETPNTVTNFIHLATTGFYDGLTFHRVIADFMVQGGCPRGDGRGGPGWEVADEFAEGLKHDAKGVLSMANAGPNTNGSQFFITLAPTPWLDGKHTVFGRVLGGLDVLDKIGAVKAGANDRPVNPVKIKSVKIFRDGKPLTGPQPKPKIT
jgi:cyclophilin family peptidyl-prolyl cis-trans isomerase